MNSIGHKVLLWAICLIGFLAMTIPVYAQFSSAVQGIVNDPTGAVVADSPSSLAMWKPE